MALAPLSIAASALAYKAIAALASIGTVALVWNAARLRGIDPVKAAALVGLNPLIVIYGVGGGHNDLLMMLIVVAGIYLMLANRVRSASAMTVAAAAIKLTAGLMLPFAIASGGARRARERRGDVLVGAGRRGGGDRRPLVRAVRVRAVPPARHDPEGPERGRLAQPPGLHRHQDRIAGRWRTSSAGCWPWRSPRSSCGCCGGSGAVSSTGSTPPGGRRSTLLLTASSLLPWYVVWLIPLAALATDRRLWRVAIVMTGVIQLIQLIGYIPHIGAGPDRDQAIYDGQRERPRPATAAATAGFSC